MKFYNEKEVEGMIEELTEAAEEAKAATLASLGREAEALAEARRLRGEYGALKSKSVKAAILTGVICLLSGLAVGAGVMVISNGNK
jgi:hypothetical protein